MSRPKENDFSERIKRLAGRSVGFRCCFPGCNRLLISKKENSDEILNTAEYAHIIAASPGGPRYDSSVSSDDIKSYDNCIVLCATHHHVIDNNPNNYPSKKLKDWKSIAEERTRQEMLLPNNYNSGEELEALFSSLLATGDYDVLRTKISDFKDVENHTFYEIVLRYKIFINVIFRKEVLPDIELYVKLGYKNIDSIVKTLIEFDCKQEIKYCYDLITDDKLKMVASLVFEKNADEIIKDVEIGKQMKEIKDTLQIKYIMNYVFGVLNQYCYIFDVNGNKKEFCSDNYYYEFVTFILRLREICLITNDYSKRDVVINEISKYINTIDNFYGYIKLNIYRYILIYLAATNSSMFEIYYNRLSLKEQKEQIISDIYYGFMIEKKSPNMIDEILSYSDRVNDYKTLFVYLANNPNMIKDFLEDHKYLLKKESAFLLLYRGYKEKEVFDKEIINYKDVYSDDFLYNCILWSINITDLEIKDWCINNEDKLSNFSIEIYLANLVLSQENKRFFQLLSKIKNIELKANYLLMFHHYNQSSKEYDNELLKEYNAINKIQLVKGINHNLAILYWNDEEYDKAFECLYKEIDNFSNINSLHLLFHFRLDKEMYIEDKYFYNALSSSDYHELVYVAEVYYHNNELDTALDYYEKALITGVNSKGCLFKIFELTNKKQTLFPKEVVDNTAVNICNAKDNRMIVFHRKNIYEGINGSNSEWKDACLLSSTYCDFLYKTVGDTVLLDGTEYKITSIEDMYTYYSSLFLRDLSLNPSTITITGPIENAMQQIKDLAQQRYDYQKTRNEKYTEIKDSLPISVSAKMFFDNKIFYNMFFLIKESNNKFMNNLKIVTGNIKNANLLFYYDAIFVLYNIYDQVRFVVPDNYYITDFVKNRIINEINDELNGIKLNDGTLGLNSQGEMVFYGKNNHTRNLDTKYLIKFKDFIEKFKVIQSCKYVLSFGGQTIGTDDIKMEDERSILSVADGNNKFIIVSENQTFNKLCDLKNVANVGITQILDQIISNEELFNIAMLLKKYNYNNYFTYNMYLLVRDEKEKLLEFMNYRFDNEADNYKHFAILQAILQELYRTKNMDIFLDSVLIDFLLKRIKSK